MNFKKLEWSDFKRYQELYAQCSQSWSDGAFSVLWGWTPFFGYQIGFEQDLAWIRQSDGTLLPPVGDWSNRDWGQILARTLGDSATLSLVPEDLALEIADQLGAKAQIEEDRSAHEYLYQVDDLVNLSGNRSMRRRHKIHQFQKSWNWSYEPFDHHKVDQVASFQQQWISSQRAKTKGALLEAEHRCIMSMLERSSQLGLIGGILYVDQKIVGYTLAEMAPDGTVQCHVEKGDEQYQGCYQALAHQFAQTLQGKTRWVNREEDMGNPGLRQAKLGYGPFIFLRKYRLGYDLSCSTYQLPALQSTQPQEPNLKESVQPVAHPVDRVQVFERMDCSQVEKSFEAKKHCATWQSLQQEMDHYLEQHKEQAAQMSDHIAANPEISGNEYATSQFYADFLDQQGFAVEKPWCGLDTAFVGRFTLGHGGPVLAFLCEYDALPVVGHGCGHNLSGVMSLFAALALRHGLEKHRMDATLWVVGTPSEEQGGGKVIISDSKVMDQVTLAMMFHCSTQLNWSRQRFLASRSFEFAFKGKAAHAVVSPWDGRSALAASRLFLDAIDLNRQTFPSGLRLSCRLEQEVGALNIVPASSKVTIDLRAEKMVHMEAFIPRLINMAQGVAMATETQVQWNMVRRGYAELKPNQTLEELSHRVMEQMKLPLSQDGSAVASSDIGNLSHHCPALHGAISICDQYQPFHTVEFANATQTQQAHQALITGATVMARIGGLVVADPDLAILIRQDFEKEN